MYGFLPIFARLMHNLPPGTRTRSTSDITLFRNDLYSDNVMSSSYVLPTLYGGDVTARWILLSGSSCMDSLDLQNILLITVLGIICSS